MNVSSVSASSGLYYQRMSSTRSQTSSDSSGTQQMQGPPPGGAPPSGGPPPSGGQPPDGQQAPDGFMTDDLKSQIDTLRQNGGSDEDVKSLLDARFDEYKQTDAYKSLSTEQQTRMQEMRDGKQPSKTSEMAQLQNSGYSTRSQILSSFFNQVDSSSDE